MIHPQGRREVPPDGGRVSADADAAPDLAEAPGHPGVLPRQEAREKHDAYDLYAQIYALRTEAAGSDTA